VKFRTDARLGVAARRCLGAAAGALALSPALACDRIVGLTDNYYETFCASRSPQPLFCEDFDEGYDGSVWSYTDTASGTVSLTETEFSSSPAALLTKSSPTNNGTINAAVYRAFSVSGADPFQGVLDFDMRLDQQDFGCQVAVLAQIGFAGTDSAGNPDQYYIQFVTNSTGGSQPECELHELEHNNYPVIYPASSQFGLNTWTHVTMKVTAPLGGGPGSASLWFDGKEVASAPTIHVPVKNFQPTIGLGITYATMPSTGWSAVYDNIVFDGNGT
jgi:hypothetical protein